MVPVDRKFSCFLIGRESFLAPCAQSHDLTISEVQTLDGKPLTISELVNKSNLKIGDIPGGKCHQFADIDSELAKQIERIETGLVKHESFWVKRLATLIPLVEPFPWIAMPAKERRSKLDRQDWTISPMINDFLIHHRPTWTLANFLVAAVVAYLSRIAQQNCFDIALKYADLDSQLAGIPSLFADRVPCRIEIDSDRDFATAFEAIDREITVVKQHRTYARDIVLRYPELRACSPLGFVDRLPVGIDRVKSLPHAAQRLDRKSTSTQDLTFTISDSGDNCYCDYNAEILDENTINRMLEQLTVFIDAIVSDPERALASLPLLSDVEHQILLKWNDTQVDFRTEGYIHQQLTY